MDRPRRALRPGPALMYGAALAIALIAVFATLVVSAPVDPKTLTAHYGKPVWLVESDMSAFRGMSKRELRPPVPLNPLENPTYLKSGRFFLSYLAFAAPLSGLVWLAMRRRSVRRRQS